MLGEGLAGGVHRLVVFALPIAGDLGRLDPVLGIGGSLASVELLQSLPCGRSRRLIGQQSRLDRFGVIEDVGDGRRAGSRLFRFPLDRFASFWGQSAGLPAAVVAVLAVEGIPLAVGQGASPVNADTDFRRQVSGYLSSSRG
ncbi:hypothetical protein [Streptomyces anulatus]|uniref:hypothetical protein n=1 Tax=Streptomyces anulatus TaxID=1892 RepID=UPI00344772D4